MGSHFRETAAFTRWKFVMDRIGSQMLTLRDLVSHVGRYRQGLTEFRKKRNLRDKEMMRELITAIVLEAEYMQDKSYLSLRGIELVSRDLWINVKDDPSFIDDQGKIAEASSMDRSTDPRSVVEENEEAP